ncbi:acyl-CoA dehydrogenase family protein [Streptomyces sp. BI20]|uniref:acyl-CoA dehydrogenase family protein n=1 Tax=Streptomyces sp. BI20 TaxID=3403460 RepID=UPI003C725C52
MTPPQTLAPAPSPVPTPLSVGFDPAIGTLAPAPETAELARAVRSVLTRREGGAAWGPLVERVGVAGLAVPEEYGGLGQGPVETAAVGVELGRVLSPVPFLGSAVVATGALVSAADGGPAGAEAAARLLPGLAEGRTSAALAWAEAGDRSRDPWAPEACRTVAVPTAEGHGADGHDGPGWRLTGVKGWVPVGPVDAAGRVPVPEVVLVFARVGDPDGPLALFETAAPPTGFRVRATLDTTRPLAEFELAGVPARRVTGPGTAEGARVLGRVRDLACVALAAEQVGAAERAVEFTVAHALDRVQFGRPIGSFQAVKHRLADMWTAVETARASMLAAAASDAAPGPAAAARSACARAATFVAGETVQLHGGIGITWEAAAHHHFKRAHGDAILFGSPEHHRDRLATLLGLGPGPDSP